MFTKLLIANRGEIACRIMRTARRMGVRTVAVYSEADAHALHVREADEAVCIGAAEARASYLVGEKIIAAAQATGAQAVHPGYGFLSENEGFAQACADAGLVFVGPPVTAIRAMGSKSAAKALMARAGVPLTPGYHGDEQAMEALRAQATSIGYPVLIKAVSGGGGKGMRVVQDEAEFADALASCQREAAASFGDARVLIEKYLLRPRHIEMQVFADTQGNVIHLFERDCSVQRRHQKVLEEAPAPGMDAAMRAAMGRAAVEAARAVGYVGAGTVEFIVPHPESARSETGTSANSFYFMEMNTRLQVEHPVTEMITGLDLVEWQLRIAAGEPLPLAQEQLALHGHAIEARIYAEDAERGFLPSTGTLTHLALPAASAHVRVDAGVAQGDAITPYYDPMIAKLIVWDADRERARARMLTAMAQCRIVGVANNVGFLTRLVACPAFAGADLDTSLIERERAWLLPEASALPEQVWHLAALAEMLRNAHHTRARAATSTDPHSPWHAGDGWRLNAPSALRIRLRHGDSERTLSLAQRGRDVLLSDATGAAHLAQDVSLDGDGGLVAVLAGRRVHAMVVLAGERRHVFVDGGSHVLAAVDPLFHAGEQGRAGGNLAAPMPGKVVALLATPGKRLDAGAPLLILEAMKMEHTISAPANGTLRGFRFAVGEQVSDGAQLVDFEPLTGEGA